MLAEAERSPGGKKDIGHPYGTILDADQWSCVTLYYFQADCDQGHRIEFERRWDRVPGIRRLDDPFFNDRGDPIHLRG